MNYLLQLFFILTLISCSSTTKNMVQTGDLTLVGGIYEDKTWADKLVLKRVSWFKELTLQYDILYADLKKEETPFYLWFSDKEKDKLKSCDAAYLYLNYTLDDRKVDHKDVLKQLEKKGYSVVDIPVFAKQLKMHPNYEYLSLQVYKSQAICGPKFSESTKVTVPGFNTVSL